MSTETTNKKIKIDNGTTFGRTYTDKAVDELLKNVSGGDIWLDITPYLNDATMSISQEGYNFLYNGIMKNDKYCGITVGEKHCLYYLEYVGNLFFEYKEAEKNAKSYLFGIYKDLHVTYIENAFIKNIPDLPSDASTKTYTLQTVNGVLTWTDAIGDINTILDNINGEVI